MSRETHVRFCEGLGVRSPRATRRFYTNNDVDENPFFINLSGVVATPEITVTILDEGSVPLGPSISDGSTGESVGLVTPGTSLTRFVEVRNDGTAPLVLEPAAISGSTAFSIVSNFTTGQSVAPGETANLELAFLSNDGGIHSGSLTFVNSDSDENPFDFSFFVDAGAEISLTLDSTPAIGDDEGLVADTPSGVTPLNEYSFATTPAGSSVTRTFTIDNVGSQPLDVTGLTLLPVWWTVLDHRDSCTSTRWRKQLVHGDVRSD